MTANSNAPHHSIKYWTNSLYTHLRVSYRVQCAHRSYLRRSCAKLGSRSDVAEESDKPAIRFLCPIEGRNSSPHGRSLPRKLSLAMMYYACPRRHSNYSLSSRCVQFCAHKTLDEDAGLEMGNSTQRYHSVHIHSILPCRDMAIEMTVSFCGPRRLTVQ
jgi:hypothetical protein